MVLKINSDYFLYTVLIGWSLLRARSVSCEVRAVYLDISRPNVYVSRDSSVGIVSGYGLNDQGGRDLESR
jgi:hypothetical protein